MSLERANSRLPLQSEKYGVRNLPINHEDDKKDNSKFLPSDINNQQESRHSDASFPRPSSSLDERHSNLQQATEDGKIPSMRHKRNSEEDSDVSPPRRKTRNNECTGSPRRKVQEQESNIQERMCLEEGNRFSFEKPSGRSKLKEPAQERACKNHDSVLQRQRKQSMTFDHLSPYEVG